MRFYYASKVVKCCYSTDLSHQHFQGFWYYEYSVEHPGDVVKSLEKRGFIQPGNLRSAIQNQTVPVIKMN